MNQKRGMKVNPLNQQIKPRQAELEPSQKSSTEKEMVAKLQKITRLVYL